MSVVENNGNFRPKVTQIKVRCEGGSFFFLFSVAVKRLTLVVSGVAGVLICVSRVGFVKHL